MQPKYIYLCWILIATSLLSGCGSDRHIRDLKQFVDQQKLAAAQNQKLSAATQLHFPSPETYQGGARSPFEDSGLATGGTATKNHPLQNYSLASLQFKGTVIQKDPSVILAFIQAPDNKLYQVKTGDVIGDHYGKITNIYPDHIEIEEVTGSGNETSKRLVTLQLKESADEHF